MILPTFVALIVALLPSPVAPNPSPLALASPTGILSTPKAKLAAILAASPTLQAWFSGGVDATPFFFDSECGADFDGCSGDQFDGLFGPVPDISGKLFYSFFEDNDSAEMAAMRPFGVLIWEHFRLGQIAGGARNTLWPKEPTLRVILTDNDPVPASEPGGLATAADIVASDTIFENLIGGVMADLANLAAVSDFLSVCDIDLDMPPTRNPPQDWAAAGAYLWASFTVKYN